MNNQDKIEKVIKGLECKLNQSCAQCPYDEDFNCIGCDVLFRDAIALLKAKEPVDVIVVHNGIDRSGGWWYQCPSCKMEVEPRDRYCKSCGQAVKWE